MVGDECYVTARIKTFPRVQQPNIYGDLLDPEEFPERFREKNGVVIWKMSSFEMSVDVIDDLMARKRDHERRQEPRKGWRHAGRNGVAHRCRSRGRARPGARPCGGLAGEQISPEAGAKLFPYRWPR